MQVRVSAPLAPAAAAPWWRRGPGRDGTRARALAWMWSLAAAWLLALPGAYGQSLAPGFTGLSRDTEILLFPLDVELFSLSAGGVAEPRADWTAQALSHLDTALADMALNGSWRLKRMDDTLADEFAEHGHLVAALSQAIAVHHGTAVKLPTKRGVLDWTVGDTLQGLKERSGSRYALLMWVRDSYASAERMATMVAMAMLGIGLSGGIQAGYATLVDLDTGRVVWFNKVISGSGDLREAAPARDSLRRLMSGLPVQKP